MKTKKLFLTLGLSLICVFLLNTAKAQYNDGFVPYWELEFNGGFSTFFGDLKQKSIFPSNKGFNEWKLGGGITFGKQLSQVFGLRIQLLTGKLLGGKEELDRYFESGYIEGNINATINLSNLFGIYNSQRKISPYVILGFGLTNFDSELYEISTGNQVAIIGHGFGKGLGGRTLEGLVLGGIGFDFRLSDNVSLKLETVNRAIASDIMDIWDDGYKHDIYNYTSVGIAFKFGKSKRKTRRIAETIPEEPPVKIVEEVVEQPEPEPEPEIISEPVVVEQPVVIETPVIPEPEYRVQIRACYQKKLSIDALAKKYNIPAEDIKEDMHNGYYIYTIGSMAAYQDARVLCDKVKTVNKVYDAFVVAFSHGKRLSKLPK